MINITLPIYYTQEFKTKKDKTFLIGLNWERNAHFFIKSEVKRHFHDLVINQIIPISNPYTLFTTHTKLYYKNPSCDGSNIIPMIHKYLLDALQECKVLSNDSVKYEMGGSWEVVGQDKLNPRCEITITPIKE